jgi:hypothetical protein
VLRLDREQLLVVDRGDRAGLSAVGADGRPSPRAGALAAVVDDPLALARDERGFVYVLDRGGERVVRATPALQFDRVVVDLVELAPDWGD